VNHRKLNATIVGTYLILAEALISYELRLRVSHMATATTGIWSYGFTLPSSFFVQLTATALFGANIGDSNVTFVAIIGLGALVNSLLLFALVRGFQEPARR
jgi:hypothetical protein